jgi:hypothetical protein
MNIRCRVELNEGERADLAAMLSGGNHAARKLKRAQILMAADAGIRSRLPHSAANRRWVIRDRFRRGGFFDS